MEGTVGMLVRSLAANRNIQMGSALPSFLDSVRLRRSENRHSSIGPLLTVPVVAQFSVGVYMGGGKTHTIHGANATTCMGKGLAVLRCSLISNLLVDGRERKEGKREKPLERQDLDSTLFFATAVLGGGKGEWLKQKKGVGTGQNSLSISLSLRGFVIRS